MEIYRKKVLVDIFADFWSLNHCRNTLEEVKSLAHFCTEISVQLLRSAAVLEKDCSANFDVLSTGYSSISLHDENRMNSTAARQQRNRVSSFDSEQGVKLRTAVASHLQKLQKTKR